MGSRIQVVERPDTRVAPGIEPATNPFERPIIETLEEPVDPAFFDPSDNDAASAEALGRVLDLERQLGLEDDPEAPIDPSVDYTFSALGRKLQNPNALRQKKIHWEKVRHGMGLLAVDSVQSPLTACWLDPAHKPDSGGYGRIYSTWRYGLPIVRDKNGRNVGMSGHRGAVILDRKHKGIEEELTEDDDVDHVCTFPGCRCRDHHEVVSRAENLQRMREALRMHWVLGSNQLWQGLTGLEEIDRVIEASLRVGRMMTGAIVLVRTGPHRLRILQRDPIIMEGVRVPDSAFDALLPRPERKSARRPRLKEILVLAGQLALFDEELLPPDLELS